MTDYPPQHALTTSGTSIPHAPETVSWYEWGPEALAEAEARDVPILLSISAVWCHWCHVMDHQNYEDRLTANFINEHFVPVRVDNDKHPDINDRYNQGGWPTTCFLTPSGELLWGATYIPPSQFAQVLQQMSDAWAEQKDEFRQRAKGIAAAYRERMQELRKRRGRLDEEIVTSATSEVWGHYDRNYGGFGSGQKFPHPEALELALSRHQDTGEPKLLEMVTHTLTRMYEGGLFDPVEGGFFRYATQPDWSEPHYEKMCEGNAGILHNAVRAYQVTGEARFAEIACGITRYVSEKLSNQQSGGFYGSQDADEEYYHLPLAERLKRQAPYIDRVIYTNWAAMMTSSYLLAGVVLEDASLTRFALQTVEFLVSECWDDARGFAHYHDGQPHVWSLFTDQAHMLQALLDSYEVAGEVRYLDRAERLAAILTSTYTDPLDGAFFDRSWDENAPGFLKRPHKSLSDNAVCAQALLRLSYLTAHEDYESKCEACLTALANDYQVYGFMAAGYALAVDLFLNRPVHVLIVGDSSDSATQSLHQAALRCPNPRKIVQLLDPESDGELLSLRNVVATAHPAAFICRQESCQGPVTEPEDLPGLLQLSAERTR